MAFTFLVAQGGSRRRFARRGRPRRPLPGAARDRAASRSRPTSWSRSEMTRRRRDAARRRDGDPRRVEGSRHRTRDRGHLRRRARGAKTVLWNGPMGVFELAPFARGHAHLAEAVADCRGLHGRRWRRQRRGGPAVRPRGSRSITCRPVVARRSSSSSSAIFPVSRHCAPATRRGSSGSIMSDRKPLMAGNWKMHHNHFEAIQVVQKLSYRLDDSRLQAGRRRRVPGVHRVAVGADHDRQRRHPDRARRAELPLGAAGRVHRRGQRADARQAARAVRDPRSLGTSRALRRDRRHGRQEGAGGPRQTAWRPSCASARRWRSGRRARPTPRSGARSGRRSPA